MFLRSGRLAEEHKHPTYVPPFSGEAEEHNQLCSSGTWSGTGVIAHEGNSLKKTLQSLSWCVQSIGFGSSS
jgi:hypothetical protein